MKQWFASGPAVWLASLACVALATMPSPALAQGDPTEISDPQADDEADQWPGPDPEELALMEAAEARSQAVLIVRLADTLEPEQRAKVLSVIDTLPTVVIGEDGTHEIGPRPSMPDIVALYEIPGAVPRAALDSSLAARGVTRPEQLFANFADENRAKYAWASNIAPPIELGDIASQVFEDRLHSHLLTLARRAALTEFAQYSSDGTISVCFGNQPPPAGHCPLPRDGLRWNEATDLAPIYLSVEAPYSMARFFSVTAISRDGAIIPLASGEGIPYAFETPVPPGGEPSRAIPEARLFFAPAQPLDGLLSPGHYDLVVIVSAEPVPPELWQRANNGADPESVCPQTSWIGLCRAMQLRKGVLPIDIESDVALVPVAVTTKIIQVERVVRGSLASLSLSRWQAQLLRYTAEDAAAPPGSFSFLKAHFCGGAYIGNGFVLTAAHCIPRNVSEMRVRLGTRDLLSGGRTFKVRSLVQHTRGNARQARVDLALIQLDADPRSLRALGSRLEDVILSTDPNAEFTQMSGLTATGWGFVKPSLPGETGWVAADGSRNAKAEQLQQVVLAEADTADCTAQAQYSAYLEKDMLCLRGLMRGTDTCAGDSGGPVTSRMGGGRRLVGIVSNGVGCAYEDVPAVYVNVAEHRGWIDRARNKMLASRPGYYEQE
jgi:secreted trypsin-like serine protease